MSLGFFLSQESVRDLAVNVTDALKSNAVFKAGAFGGDRDHLGGGELNSKQVASTVPTAARPAILLSVVGGAGLCAAAHMGEQDCNFGNRPLS